MISYQLSLISFAWLPLVHPTQKALMNKRGAILIKSKNISKSFVKIFDKSHKLLCEKGSNIFFGQTRKGCPL
ncbi:MAG TPA: hypothetical protein DCM38_06345 [Gammaproteobacteria bacterium]|nr:hypothetical protein [Gammaproteobacteria bacterium]